MRQRLEAPCWPWRGERYREDTLHGASYSRDVVQSALLSGLRHFSDFRGDTDGELFAWLKAIIRTKIHRAGRRKAEAPEELGEVAHPVEDLKLLDGIINRELAASLHEAIMRLPLEQRLVLELRLRGLNSTQIASLLGLTSATVRKRESRGVANLRLSFRED